MPPREVFLSHSSQDRVAAESISRVFSYDADQNLLAATQEGQTGGN
jgi:hypothetical protein